MSAEELDVELITKLHRIDDYAGGVEMLERIVSRARAALGPQHPRVSFHLNELGLLFRELGRFQDAEASFQQARRSSKEQPTSSRCPNPTYRVNSMSTGVLSSRTTRAGLNGWRDCTAPEHHVMSRRRGWRCQRSRSCER